MGIYLNFGNKGFEQSLRSDIYVDKTGLIEFVNKRLDTEQRFLCVSRPRRFGKSMAAKMLAAYYSRGCDSSGLFKGLAISKAADYREHLNKYNVIHVDMNDFVLSAERKENPFYVVDGFQEKVLAELRDAFSQAKHIYNPNSLVNAIEEQECDTYWTRTESFESLRGYISMNFQGLEDAVIQMLAGNRCHVDTLSFSNDMETFHDKDDVLTLLIHLGYLDPNEEVKAEFQDAVKRVGWAAVVKAVQESEQLLRDTWDGDEDAVAEGISHVHMQNTPVLKYNDENSLSCVITLAYYNAMNEYTIVRELPSGRGFAHMVFIPKKFSDKPAMIIELKCDATAEGAITQIREKQYVRALEGYEGEILLVGINYDRKTKKHECKIEKAGEAAS